MKKIVLKTIEGKADGNVIRIAYKDQIDAIMSTPMDMKNADLNEVRRSLRILDVLDGLPAEAQALELEDADYEYMKQRVLAARWPIISKVILTFIEDVTKE